MTLPHGVVGWSAVWLWYFLIILPYFFIYSNDLNMHKFWYRLVWASSCDSETYHTREGSDEHEQMWGLARAIQSGTHKVLIKTLRLLVSSADNFCKQFGTRSCPTKCRAWSGSKLFATLVVLLSEGIFQKKLIFKKFSRRQKSTKNYRVGKELR